MATTDFIQFRWKAACMLRNEDSLFIFICGDKRVASHSIKKSMQSQGVLQYLWGSGGKGDMLHMRSNLINWI